MTHDELLKVIIHGQTMNYEWRNALRAVVELHKPFDAGDDVAQELGEEPIWRCECDPYDEYDRGYPCPTIQAIEKELR